MSGPRGVVPVSQLRMIIEPCGHPLEAALEAMAWLPPELGADLPRVRHPGIGVPHPRRHGSPLRLARNSEHSASHVHCFADRGLHAGANVVDRTRLGTRML